MKYDVLEPLKVHLHENLSKNTARKYYSSVIKLLKDTQFNSIDEISEEFIKNESILKFKTKNEFSAVKNGLLHLKEVYPQLDLPEEDFFKGVSIKKRNWTKKPKKNIYLDTTKRKINQIKDPKLRYAYRLALVSGLRVSELAALEKKDIRFREDGTIQVDVRHGKGGSNGMVPCLEDHYLYSRLKDYLEALKDDDRPFYSSVYMRKIAYNLGFECHDLRRAFAIMYRNKLKEEMPVSEANQEVKKLLRHKRFSTTKRYLFNKKLIVREKNGKGGTDTCQKKN